MTLTDQIMGAIPDYGCTLKVFWASLKAHPKQGIEAALQTLRARAAIRIHNGIITRTNVPAIPVRRIPAPPTKPELTIEAAALAAGHRRLRDMLANERQRCVAECRAIRLDKGLNTAEQLEAMRQADESSRQRQEEIRARFQQPQAKAPSP